MLPRIGVIQTWRQPDLSLAPPPPAGNRTILLVSVLRIDPHTLLPRQTTHGQAAALAWGSATPRAKRVS